MGKSEVASVLFLAVLAGSRFTLASEDVGQPDSVNQTLGLEDVLNLHRDKNSDVEVPKIKNLAETQGKSTMSEIQETMEELSDTSIATLRASAVVGDVIPENGDEDSAANPYAGTGNTDVSGSVVSEDMVVEDDRSGENDTGSKHRNVEPVSVDDTGTKHHNVEPVSIESDVELHVPQTAHGIDQQENDSSRSRVAPDDSKLESAQGVSSAAAVEYDSMTDESQNLRAGVTKQTEAVESEPQEELPANGTKQETSQAKSTPETSSTVPANETKEELPHAKSTTKPVATANETKEGVLETNASVSANEKQEKSPQVTAAPELTTVVKGSEAHTELIDREDSQVLPAMSLNPTRSTSDIDSHTGQSVGVPVASNAQTATDSESETRNSIRPASTPSTDEEPGNGKSDKNKEITEGSLAHFFKKVSNKQKNPLHSRSDQEASTSFENLVYKAEVASAASEVQAPVSDNKDPEYSFSWGVYNKYKRVPDMELLYMVFEDRLKRELGIIPDAAQKENLFPLGIGSEVDETAQRDDFKAGSDFVDNLADIDNLFEGVDPPDELDVGASGSSMQEVLVGKGGQILVKRVVLGCRFLRRICLAAKEKLVERFTNEAGDFSFTKDNFQEAALGVWHAAKKLARAISNFVDRFLEGDGNKAPSEEKMDMESLQKFRRQDPTLAAALGILPQQETEPETDS